MNKDELKTCIATLHDLRKQMPQELKTSFVMNLDSVIERLEACCESGDGEVEVPVSLRIRTLGVIAEGLMLATNLTELIARWTGRH